MARDREAGLLLDAPQRVLEAIVREGLDTAALVADEVVMMVVGDVDALVVSAAVAEVELLNQLLLGEEVEDAVDAGDPDLAALGAELVRDLGCGVAAVAAREHGDDRAPRCAGAVARPAKSFCRLLLPAHASNDNDSRYRITRVRRVRLHVLPARR